MRAISYGQLGRAGLAAQDLEKGRSAVDDLNLGYRLNPWPSKVYYTRGLAHFHLGNYPQAIFYFDEAIHLDSGDAAAYKDRGKANLSLGRYEDAVADLNMAINLSPRFPEAFALRGRAYLALGREGPAARDLETAEQLKGGS